MAAGAESGVALSHCLVTGAGTAVGREVVRALLLEGAFVRALDRGRVGLGHERLEVLRGEAADYEVLRGACQGASVVFHCERLSPARSLPRRGERRARDGRDADNLVRACREAGVPRLVFGSGDCARLDESDVAAEARLRRADVHGPAACAIRTGVVWGGDDCRLLGGVVGLCARGWYVALPLEGEALCELSHAERVGRAMLAAARRLESEEGMRGEVFTVVDGPPVDPFEHLDPVMRALGFTPPRRRLPTYLLSRMAALWERLHEVHLATAPPVGAAWGLRFSRARIEDPPTREAATRMLCAGRDLPESGPAAGSALALDRSAQILAGWEAGRRERIGRSWSLPFFIRLPNLRRTLAVITRFHRAIYLATSGRLGHVVGGTSFLLLHHVGRRSGRDYLTPLLYVADGPRYIVAASNAGDARPPAWWLNVREQETTWLQAGNRRVAVRVRRAREDECERLWPLLTASYRWFASYRAHSGREIPIVLLEPVTPELPPRQTR